MAMALTHHLYFSQQWSLKDIARLLSQQTSSTLITEFMANGLGGTRPHPNPLPENYHVGVFAAHLEHYFTHVEVVDYPSQADGAKRIFLLCREKRPVSLPYSNGPLPDGL